MIIWSSINFPTVIFFPLFAIFLEKPLVKPTPPKPLFIIFAFAIYFSFAFIFRSIKLKIQKYLAAIYPYLFYLAFNLWIYYNLSHVIFPILRRCTPAGIDNPFNTSGCVDLLSVCRECLRCVAWFSYWFDNLGLIKGKYLPPLCCIIPSFLMKYRRSSSRISNLHRVFSIQRLKRNWLA